MAPIKVKNSQSPKELGKAVLAAAVSKALAEDTSSIETAFQAVWDREVVAGRSGVPTPCLCYDSESTVNVVIPFLTQDEGKALATQQTAAGDAEGFNLVKFSQEAMGHIVILGCGE